MTQEHSWRDCRPALLNIDKPLKRDTEDPAQRTWHESLDRAWDAVELVWMTVDEADRRRFHEFTCESQHSEEHLRTMELISSAIRDLLG